MDRMTRSLALTRVTEPEIDRALHTIPDPLAFAIPPRGVQREGAASRLNRVGSGPAQSFDAAPLGGGLEQRGRRRALALIERALSDLAALVEEMRRPKFPGRDIALDAADFLGQGRTDAVGVPFAAQGDDADRLGICRLHDERVVYVRVIRRPIPAPSE